MSIKYPQACNFTPTRKTPIYLWIFLDETHYFMLVSRGFFSLYEMHINFSKNKARQLLRSSVQK